jgi:hypothetical protein
MVALAPWTRSGNGTLMARRSADRPDPSDGTTQITPLSCGFGLERVTRIELALSAWEADVLPLNYTRARS